VRVTQIRRIIARRFAPRFDVVERVRTTVVPEVGDRLTADGARHAERALPGTATSNETSAVLAIANGWAGTEQLAPGVGEVVPQRHHHGVGDDRRDPPTGPRPAARRGGPVNEGFVIERLALELFG
jgi:hypothetical protein